QGFRNHTDKPLTLPNFLTFYNLELKHIYKNHLFSTLCAEAFGSSVNSTNVDLYKAMLSKKWIVTESLSYFRFILSLVDVDFELHKLPLTEENRLMALMLHYDFYQKATQEMTLDESIRNIGVNKDFVKEMKEFLEVKIDKIG